MEFTEVKMQIKEKLPMPIEFSNDENLIELGLNSLMIMRFVNQLRKQGVKVSFGKLMEEPTLNAWWELIQKGTKEKKKVKKSKPDCVEEAGEKTKEPFALTDVQYAYWVGRSKEQVLGDIGCHAYLEFDGNGVSPERLEKAWNQLQMHHPMLRARFLENGTQEIMEHPYTTQIEIHDFRELSGEQAERSIEKIREQLSHRKLQVENGQVAGIEVSLLPKGNTRVHLDLDLLIADVQSLQILLRDLATAYTGGILPEESKDWDFGKYLAHQKETEKEDKKIAKRYWKERLETFPGGPQLPMAKRPEEVKKTVFRRRKRKLSKEDWDALSQKAKEKKTTPALILLTSYAAVMERFSTSKHFLINIPYFNRNTELKGLEEVIADFTTLLLLEVNAEGNPSFEELHNRIQKQLFEDMNHTSYSGVQVQRDLARIHGGQQATAPMVFACNLGTPLVNQKFRESIGEFTYMISQTPQVWNDFQTYEDESGLLLTWDTVDELFPEGMITDMLDSLEQLLHKLIREDWNQPFDLLPEYQRSLILKDCDVKISQQPNCLHTAFLQKAEEQENACALIDTGAGISITYGELREHAMRMAAALVEKKIQKEAIAITLPRGYQQIEAALAILISGNTYVPVSCDQPKERRTLIHNKTGVHYVITNEDRKPQIQWPEHTEVMVFEEMRKEDKRTEYPEVSPTDSAYIIMTSGSTGVPKGVEVAHGTAWNTIQDINQKYQITEQDTAFCISAMDFDLSVYDVFGLLGSGGKLILIEEERKRDAGFWLEQVKQYQVTVWNSVPIILDMLLVQAEAGTEELPLRVVMLSGDWIGMDLPERLMKCAKYSRMVAMGGATEASIWSNYYDVTLPLPAHWKSIPYGRPLDGQVYRVVDELGRDCPSWVEGELWIGGNGVAKGYRGDSELTAEKFITDSLGRWYRTGDNGRFWGDRTIEFLGRKDNQVKIRGHRIELGEIEHAISEFHGVKNAVVEPIGEKQGDKFLVAYVEAGLEEDSSVTCNMKLKDEAIGKLSLQNAEQASSEAYETFMKCANLTSIQIMMQTFKKMGIFLDAKESYTLSEIIETCNIDSEQENTISRWLAILTEEGLLEQTNDRYTLVENGELEFNNIASVEAVTNYTKQLIPHVIPMLKAEESPIEVFYEKNKELAPNALLHQIPGQAEQDTYVLELVKQITREKKNSPIRILELGTRNLAMTKALWNELKDSCSSYSYVDTSKYFLNEIKETCEDIELRLYDPDKEVGIQQFPLHQYDLVIAFQSLHRNKNASFALKQVSDFLAPSGVLLMTELVARTYLQDITAAFLEQGFSDITDRRKETKAGILSNELWQEYIAEQNLKEETGCQVFGRSIMCIRQKPEVLSYQEEGLRAYLKKKLPEFMVPKVFTFMERIPITSNGKVDRKALRGEYQVEHVSAKQTKPQTKTQENVLQIWRDLFQTENIGIEDNYFTLGGDSLVATKLISKVQESLNCKIGISEIFGNPTVEGLAAVIDSSTQESVKLPQIVPDEENQYQSFPLTEVQYAYWIGRSGLYDLGQVSTHCYFELDAKKLDISKAQVAWNKMVKRHGMMRVVIEPNGKQRILEKVPEYQIEVTDTNHLPEEKQNEVLKQVREDMSHQVITTDEWPLFDVRITNISDENQRIHISFDNLIFDGWSMFYILSEWADIYRGKMIPDRLSLSFRDYVLGLEEVKHSAVYEEDKKYWMDRIEGFSKAPELPLAKNENEIVDQKFHRRSDRLPAEVWNVLRGKAREIGVTPSVLLMSAYSEVLRLWSAHADFTINLTQFDRKPLHPQVEQLVGDFTTFTLLEVKEEGTANFAERAKAVQTQLSKDLGHSFYSAVEMERELKAQEGNPKGAIMPIVFTSGLGVSQWNEGNWLGQLTYNISQTPQVWLDHQVVEMDGALCLFWDSLDELFYPGMIDEMFQTYVNLLKDLAAKPELFEKEGNSLLDASISDARKQANDTQEEFKTETLASMFLSFASQFGSREAVITPERRLTYDDVKAEAYAVANELRKAGMKKEETVAIFMDKGWEQVVAALGILFAGGAYLPIDVHNPKERIQKIMEDSKTRLVLVQKEKGSEQSWGSDYQCIPVEGKRAEHLEEQVEVKPEELAYVIYTSGTTGMPKGVMISHQGAVNTIQDVNRRYHVTKEDKAIGLSNLHFDLSVYDIFGLLSAGGAVVIPDAKKVKDPSHWTSLMNQENITIWNTVPAFMEMLVEYEEHQNQPAKKNLRLVLMSGDWIPVTLPERIRNLFGNLEIISLGGATEASIWSNAFEIPEEIPEGWKSIPYGKPLANQKYYVLDEHLENCPDWVAGTLYIGGTGVAKGYLNDEARTKEKFIIHPKTKEYLYCTGDMGRYWSDGTIEFLGREDSQTKIQGYRVELGEIERAISGYKGIYESRVIFIKNQGGSYLIAFYKGDTTVSERDIKDYLAKKVPDYMIPEAYYPIEELPKTGNGKIDRKKLENIAMEQFKHTDSAKREPETEEEKKVAEIWKSVLQCEKPGAEDNFFSHGGNSLKAIQLVNEINETYQLELSIQQVFEHATIEKLAVLVTESAPVRDGAEDTEDGEI